MPMMDLFDKGSSCGWARRTSSAGSTNPAAAREEDDDPLGVEELATHQLPLDEAPHAYEMFQKKEDGAIKVVLKP